MSTPRNTPSHSGKRGRLPVGLILTVLTPILLAPLAAFAVDTWVATGSLNHTHYAPTATLLNNGKVLLAAGYGDNLSSAELYDPGAGTWANTGSLNTGRMWHTATLLTNGKVLVVGGSDGGNILSHPRSTIRPPDGPPLGPSPPPAGVTRQPSCPAARSWWRGVLSTPGTI